MLKGIEKMERSARYIVRQQKDGQYTVVMSRPEWANREIPGFATEAEANVWIAARRHNPGNKLRTKPLAIVMRRRYGAAGGSWSVLRTAS